jgi:stage II sporulation protein D
MKVSRIVKKRTNKRDAFGFLLFVFLLPYVCARLWGHAGAELKTGSKEGAKDAQKADVCLVAVEMDWGTWELPMEEYLVYALAVAMPEDYEKEALKAQAVLLRTQLVEVSLSAEQENTQTLNEEENVFLEGTMNQVRQIDIENNTISRFYYEDNDEALAVYRDAVEETEGIYLCYQGNPIRAAYFPLSNGHTRSAEAVWQTDEYPYLSSVDCGQDKASRDWKSSVTYDRDTYLSFLRQSLGEDWSEETLWDGGSFLYDEAGYVTEVVFEEGDKTANIGGEEFRHLFGLQSASFQMEQGTGQVTFSVTGAGHGFGMSQYTANVKALNGDSYDQILKFFFRDTELAKFE